MSFATVAAAACEAAGFVLVFAGLWVVFPPAAVILAGATLVAFGWVLER